MSGVVYEHSLEETLPRANTIVIAVPADPPTRVIEINIAPDGQPPSEQYPPYQKRLYRYRIEEVLRGDAAVGSDIEVATTSGVTLEAHRLYHVKKISKILPYDRYQSSLTDEDRKGDPRRILLLTRLDPGRWLFACDGSEEPVRLRAKIESLLGA